MRGADVDAFIALGSERPDGRQDAMTIAGRLLTAGRPAEALDWIRRPARRGIRAMSAGGTSPTIPPEPICRIASGCGWRSAS